MVWVLFIYLRCCIFTPQLEPLGHQTSLSYNIRTAQDVVTFKSLLLFGFHFEFSTDIMACPCIYCIFIVTCCLYVCYKK